MTTASQLIQSNKEVEDTVVTDRICVTTVLCDVGFLNRPHFYSSVQEKAVQLCGLNLGSVQE